MVKNGNYKKFKTLLNSFLITLLGVSCIVFGVMYVESCGIDVIKNNSNVFTAILTGIVSAITVLTIVFYSKNQGFVYKIFIIIISLFAILLFGLYLFKVTGLSEKIKSVEDFRNYIASFGGNAVFLFILIQFLQVVVLPIPAFITVGAGVLLFGSFYGALYSSIGIITGSIVAFVIGKVFGKKVAVWLVGEKELDKWLKKIKGKDKILITFMFLFPFFPDDILCFVAGITSMSSVFFISMILVVRVITVFTSSYSMNNEIIPYDTWWGILIWAVFFTCTVILTVIVCKNGEKIENWFKNKKLKKHNKNKDKNSDNYVRHKQ